MLHPKHRAMLRMSLIPASCALGFGWYGYRGSVPWSDYLLGAGIFCTTLVVLLLEREGW
jgi:hypothetical protein